MFNSTRGRIVIITILVILFTACLAGFPGSLFSRLPKSGEPTQAPTQTGNVSHAYAIPTPNILYYQVKGSTESELAKEIQTKGPNGFAGYTNWYIRWGWPGFGHEECDLSGAWITTKVSVTLPEWDPTVGVPSDLIKNWTEFSQALYKHEMGHVGNITDALPLIEDAIHSADCVTADSAANAVLDKLRGRDVQYDDKTDHGRTQGAVFP
jgi:predicted secreted Zn-dependent protease